MTTREKSASFMHSWLRPLLAGLCVGVLGCTLWLLLAALLIRSVDIPRGMVGPLSLAAAALGAVGGGLTAAKTAGHRCLVMGALCGTGLFLIILLLTCLRTGSAGGTFTLIKGAVLIAAGSVGGVLGVSRRRR